MAELQDHAISPSEKDRERVEALWKVVGQYRGDVESCYRDGLKMHHFLEGTVTCQFAVTPEGQVVWSHVESQDLRSPRVEKCISEKICGWDFSPIKGEAAILVEYPIHLGVPRRRTVRGMAVPDT